jgi:hypothetical protein
MSGEDCIFIMMIHFTYGNQSNFIKEIAWNCAATIGNRYPLLHGMKGPNGNKLSYEVVIFSFLVR